MRTIITIIATILGLSLYAQVDISNTTVNASAELVVVSPNNNTGVLIPSLTEAQITAYTTNATSTLRPYKGMLIFNATTKRFMYNAGDQTTVMWSYVGSIPVFANYTSVAGTKGDIRYSVTDNLVHFCTVSGSPGTWKVLDP